MADSPDTQPAGPTPVERLVEEVGEIEISSVLQTDFEYLLSILSEIHNDEVVEVPEVIPRRIAVRRLIAESNVTEYNKIEALLSDPGLPLEGKRKNLEKLMELEEHIKNLHERNARDIAVWLQVRLYIQYVYEYRNIQARMKNEGVQIELGDPPDMDRTIQREREMKAHIDRIMAALGRQAAIATVEELELEVAYRGKRHLQEQLEEAIRQYNNIVPHGLPMQPPPGSDDPRWLRRLIDPLRVQHLDELDAELAFSSPAIAQMYVLYRRCARVQRGTEERNAVLEEMRELAQFSSADTTQERQAKKDLQRFLAGDKRDIFQRQDSLPVGEIEGIIMTGELLYSYMEQLIEGRKELTEESLEHRRGLRSYLADRVNAVFEDLTRARYLLSRERAGYENVRMGYAGDTPEEEIKPIESVKFGSTGGVGEMERQQALREIDATIEGLRSAFEPTLEDHRRELTEKILTMLRKLLRKFEELDKILKTDEDELKPIPEILAEDDKAKERLIEDMEIEKYILQNLWKSTAPAHPKALPKAGVLARQRMSFEEIEQAREPYAMGTKRLTLEEVNQRIAKAQTDPKEAVLLWLQLDAQTLYDLSLYDDVRSEMLRERLVRAGDDVDEMRAEEREALPRFVPELGKFGWDWFAKRFKDTFGFSVWWVIGAGGAVGAIVTDRVIYSYTGLSPIRGTFRAGRGTLRFGSRLTRSGAGRASRWFRRPPPPPPPPGAVPPSGPVPPPAGPGGSGPGGLRRGPKPKPKTPSGSTRPGAAPEAHARVKKTPKKAPSASRPLRPLSASERWNRMKGHAGYALLEIALVAEVINNLQQTANAEVMNEYETIDAALEFWSAAWRRKAGARRIVDVTCPSDDWMSAKEIELGEIEVMEQLKKIIPIEHNLRSSKVPADPPALPKISIDRLPVSIRERVEFLRRERSYLQALGAELEQRRLNLLRVAKELHAERTAQFPVYKPNKPLVEQPFSRDRRVKGRINVNTSGTVLGFIPVKFKNGPIECFREAGNIQRSGFRREEEKERFRGLERSLWDFQDDLREYLERSVQYEADIEELEKMVKQK